MLRQRALLEHRDRERILSARTREGGEGAEAVDCLKALGFLPSQEHSQGSAWSQRACRWE